VLSCRRFGTAFVGGGGLKLLKSYPAMSALEGVRPLLSSGAREKDGMSEAVKAEPENEGALYQRPRESAPEQNGNSADESGSEAGAPTTRVSANGEGARDDQDDEEEDEDADEIMLIRELHGISASPSASPSPSSSPTPEEEVDNGHHSSRDSHSQRPSPPKRRLSDGTETPTSVKRARVNKDLAVAGPGTSTEGATPAGAASSTQDQEPPGWKNWRHYNVDNRPPAEECKQRPRFCLRCSLLISMFATGPSSSRGDNARGGRVICDILKGTCTPPWPLFSVG
jgi:hypothetical protein